MRAHLLLQSLEVVLEDYEHMPVCMHPPAAAVPGGGVGGL